jgi:hypothetical protein
MAGTKANTWEEGVLDLLFLNTAFTLVGDASGLLPSGAPGSLYISLHTADPGEAGDQTTSEATFGSYARVAVARSGVGWTRTGSTIENAASIGFPTCASGSNVITHFGIGTSSAGAGKLLYSGDLTVPKTIAAGDTASFAAGALTVAEG